MYKILWIGPIVYPKLVDKFIAISPAANKWQWRMINSLKKNNSVQILSYIPYPFWPKGVLYPQLKNFSQDHSGLTYVKYLNLPFFREKSLARELIKKVYELISVNDSFSVIITYNALYRHIKVAEQFQKKGFKWVSIIADDVAHGKPNLTVFLSHDYYKRFTGNKIFFEGIIKQYVECPIVSNPRKIILYAGSVSPWTGIVQFAKIFKDLNLQDVELHIYGKDLYRQISSIEGNGVVYKGFVSDEQLHNAFKDAYAFVNPRPHDILKGDNNFPSKILDYISYGKPIVGTITKGIPEEYSEIIFSYNNNNNTDIYNILNKVLSLTELELIDIKHKSKIFIQKKVENNFFQILKNHLFDYK